jgi:hypothetical protein
MISVVGLDAGDLGGMAMAIAMSNCRSRLTRDPSAVEVGGRHAV